jgi:hypothetical protein
VLDGAHGLRSNIMLTCETGYDQGEEQTGALLTDHMANMLWQTEVATALRTFKAGTRSNCDCDPHLLRQPLL